MSGSTASGIGLPPAEAIRFFRGKTNATTQHWTDVWQEGHSRAFSVAGAATEALVQDFRAEVQRALEQGTTLKEFRGRFDEIVAKHGWVHNGSPGWRARIIYETNLSTAYSAGRYAEQTRPETLAAFPYWQYVHSGSAHPRKQHQAWNGLVLRADDPWWNTHYPPNGWRCGCRTRPLTGRALGRQGKSGPDEAPPLNLRPWRNPRTGQVVEVPDGIDPGFGYNPGRAWERGAEPPASGAPALPPPPPPAAPLLPGERPVIATPPLRSGSPSPASVPPPSPAPVRPLELPAASDLVPAKVPPVRGRPPEPFVDPISIVPISPRPAVPGVPARALLPAAPANREEIARFLEVPRGSLPIATLAPDVQAAIGASSANVLLSAETVAKQLAHHPELVLEDYAAVASLLRSPALVLQDRDRHAALLKVAGVLRYAVVKATGDGSETYLVSLRRIRPVDARRLLRRAVVLAGSLDALEGE